MRLVGHTTAIEDSVAWSVGYDIRVSAGWVTEAVRATSISADGTRELDIVREADGTWIVDGEPRPDLDGCFDIDFESSAVTNTLPVHRIDFLPGEPVEVPAALVRADDLQVERLEQRYMLTSTPAEGPVFHYESSTFGFESTLRYDGAGFVVDYPGIAGRVL